MTENLTFLPMPVRVAPEREQRLKAAERRLQYFMPFLDEQLHGIFPNDLILLGAPTGMGKTDFALNIAASNAARGKVVAYFALEAEPLELERRMKYRRLLGMAWADFHNLGIVTPGLEECSFGRWMAGLCEDTLGQYDQRANQYLLEKHSKLRTLYRGREFTAENLTAAIRKVHEGVDLIVVDHLHYVDPGEGRDENAGLGDTTKAVRDIALEVGKPVLLVAHLRKRDGRAKQITATLDDFHGSSNITKIATQVITLDRAWSVKSPKWFYSPTFVSVLKDRRDGSNGITGVAYYDKRSQRYKQEYTAGRLEGGPGGQTWTECELGNYPKWARSHVPMEKIA